MPIGSRLLDAPTFSLVLALDILVLLTLGHAGDWEYGMDLFPFLAVSAVTLVAQRLLSGSYYSVGAALNMWALLFALTVGAGLLAQRDSMALIWKIINFFNLFAAGCIIAQVVMGWFGVRLDRVGGIWQLLFNAWDFTAAFRPAGAYAEPAMFAQPALLSLYYSLFVGKSWPVALVISLALVMSTSAMGLMGLLLLLGAWAWNLDKLYGISPKAKWRLLALLCATAAVVLVWALDRDVFVVKRLFSGSSIGVRVLRSVDLFREMSPGERLYGIGLQNQAAYLDHYHIALAHDTYETTFGGYREYAATLGYLLCTTGFFGLVSFVWPCYRAFVRGGFRAKTVSILIIYCTMSCAMHGDPILILYFVALYATVDMERKACQLHTPANLT